MPTPGYNLVPHFGLDRWKEIPGLPNGGAEFSGDNLIITLWGAQNTKPPSPGTLPVIGDLLVARYANESVPEDQRNAFDSAHLAKLGARFLLDDFDDALQDNFLLAVLNPPAEIKQQLAGSVVFNGGDPLDAANYSFPKSQQSQFVWGQLAVANPGSNSFQPAPGGDPPYAISQYAPLNVPTGAGDVTLLPFLRTNGADGVAPVGFDQASAGGVQEMIDVVDKGGEYYIALFMDVSSVAQGGDAQIYTFDYPYSASRG